MESITGNPRPNHARDGHTFDALIAPRHTTVTVAEQREDPSTIEDLMLDDPPARRASSMAATVVILVAISCVVLAVIALVTAPQQPAGAASVEAASTEETTASGPVTAADVAAQVEQGWTEAGASGSVSCPEPVALTPGTTIDCTAVYDSTPLVFTAVIGDTDAGEPRIVIASWSEVASG